MDRWSSLRVRNLVVDEGGAVLVEVTVVMTIMLVFLLGAIEFLFIFYQHNAAAKAVQVGSRIAAVSDPVARGLNQMTLAVLGPSVPPGAAMPEPESESCRKAARPVAQMSNRRGARTIDISMSANENSRRRIMREIVANGRQLSRRHRLWHCS